MRAIPPGITAGFLLLAGAFATGVLTAAETPGLSAAPVPTADHSIWVDGIGSGYLRKARTVDLSLSRGLGTTHFGGNLTHDLWLGHLTVSQVLNDVWAPDRWYGGNLLVAGEIMAGAQDRPDPAYLAFGNFGVRYALSTAGRLVPFVEATAGAGATKIGGPDLSGGIQFDERAGLGVRYYFNQRLSATVAFHYMHISNGGYHEPNSGVNTCLVSFGMGWAL